MKRITCINEDNVQIEFSYDEDAVFFLETLDGAYSVLNNVATSANTMTDGSTYQGSTTKQRNIVITTSFDDDYQNRRDFLYRAFKPKSPGTFTYYEGEEVRQIDYIVESVEIEEKGVVRNAVISLICPDPFFKDIQESETSMAGWVPGFEFVHEFLEGGEEFGTRVAEKVKTIENNAAADHIGLTIEIEATGPVTNPAIHHQEEDIYIKVGTTGNPFVMTAGQILRITTGTNEKNVYLIETDDTETKINEYLDEGSDFIQLVHGLNTFIYEADGGVDYMNVTISYRLRYLGV